MESIHLLICSLNRYLLSVASLLRLEQKLKVLPQNAHSSIINKELHNLPDVVRQHGKNKAFEPRPEEEERLPWLSGRRATRRGKGRGEAKRGCTVSAADARCAAGEAAGGARLGGHLWCAGCGP